MIKNYLLITFRNLYSLLIILLATTVTIAGKVYQAALQNPVDCLRYE